MEELLFWMFSQKTPYKVLNKGFITSQVYLRIIKDWFFVENSFKRVEVYPNITSKKIRPLI